MPFTRFTALVWVVVCLSVGALMAAAAAAPNSGVSTAPRSAVPQSTQRPNSVNPSVSSNPNTGRTTGGTDAQREKASAACDNDNGLACEVGQDKVCRSGKWICVGAATPSR